MILSDVGESRVNGYLYVLERSLATFLPGTVVRDAVREIESHLRERIGAVGSVADERATLEQILRELGPPLRVAQAYSAERTLDEAVVTGRFVPIVRAFWHLAVTSVLGFLAALGLFAGYLCGLAFLVIGLLKPIFPNNVGFWSVNGEGSFPTSLGIKFATEQHAGRRVLGDLDRPVLRAWPPGAVTSRRASLSRLVARAGGEHASASAAGRVSHAEARYCPRINARPRSNTSSRPALSPASDDVTATSGLTPTR